SEEWAIFRAIYEPLIGKRPFKFVIAKLSLFIAHLLMATKDRHEKKEYVKPNMFFMRQLGEAKKNKPLSTNTSSYKHQREKLVSFVEAEPPPTPKKKEKEKVEPQGERLQKRVSDYKNYHASTVAKTRDNY
ncbi:Hypothetical predicted protein, partial [Olea europaea subsp. europaea]